MKSSDGALHQKCYDELFIEGLEIQMSIGILPHEQQHKQRVVVDVSAFVARAGNLGDDIGNVVSYAEIAELIKTLADQQHYNLVETFAETIAEACLRIDKINQVSIRVCKPDIMSDVAAAGIRIIRTRN